MWSRAFTHAEIGRGGLVRGHGKMVIWDSGLLLYVCPGLSHQVQPLIYKRFHHVYNHWVWRLLTKDRRRKICVRLLGVVGARDDDHSGVRSARRLR